MAVLAATLLALPHPNKEQAPWGLGACADEQVVAEEEGGEEEESILQQQQEEEEPPQGGEPAR